MPVEQAPSGDSGHHLPPRAALWGAREQIQRLCHLQRHVQIRPTYLIGPVDVASQIDDGRRLDRGNTGISTLEIEKPAGFGQKSITEVVGPPVLSAVFDLAVAMLYFMCESRVSSEVLLAYSYIRGSMCHSLPKPLPRQRSPRAGSRTASCRSPCPPGRSPCGSTCGTDTRRRSRLPRALGVGCYRC